ncbi:MAG: hypothetical protein KIT33_15115 [Candidatus Kapabacteria bacterium]|nr:hypothetical protein [Ignavibacteriota bacterium]MCW5886300.1 hypothetical protein [Candidatus Kapabacteria bacterium]
MTSSELKESIKSVTNVLLKLVNNLKVGSDISLNIGDINFEVYKNFKYEIYLSIAINDKVILGINFSSIVEYEDEISRLTEKISNTLANHYIKHIT